jgi:hypothetical protein
VKGGIALRDNFIGMMFLNSQSLGPRRAAARGSLTPLHYSTGNICASLPSACNLLPFLPSGHNTSALSSLLSFPISNSGWHECSNLMATTYYSASRSSRDHFVEPPSLISRIFASMPSGLSVQIRRFWDRQSYSMVSTRESRIPRPLHRWHWHPRSLLSLPHLLVVIWTVTLLWGERWVFQSAIKACQWESWERWVGPPRIIFRRLLSES